MQLHGTGGDLSCTIQIRKLMLGDHSHNDTFLPDTKLLSCVTFSYDLRLRTLFLLLSLVNVDVQSGRERPSLAASGLV